MTSQILALREHLAAEQVTCVVMEATGDCWKPFYYLLEDLPGVEVMLVNARHVKTVPGRKTDVADATWLAQLVAHGLVKASFVPPEPIRQLRDLTRARTAITRERAREAQRLEKLLEDSGIKLSAVASDILGVSGRAMLAALIAGDRDPAALADMAKRRLRSKIPELTEALNGRFNEHHAFLTQVHLELIDRHTDAIEKLTARIEVIMEPFQGFHDLICTIPGISTITADAVVAETGADMSRFPTAKHLASWAGTTPGNNESAGKVKSSRSRPGNPYPARSARRGGHGVFTEPAHLLRRPLPTHRQPARAQEGQRRDPALDVDRDLADGHYRNPLRRPRRRLLHPTQPPAAPRNERSTSSRPWATASPWTTRPETL